MDNHKRKGCGPVARGLRAAAMMSTLTVVPAAADEFHYVNMLVGDRAAGLAGAYVAVADDPAGLYYNPAGIVYAQGGSVSASMNTYHTSTKTYRDVLGGQDWQRQSASLLPNFFGVVQPLGDGMIGFSYAVPDSVLEDQDQLLLNLPANVDGNTATAELARRYTINFSNGSDVYHLGPSYAHAFGDDFSIGLTLYGHFRKQKLIVNQLVEIDADSDGNLDGGIDTYEWSNLYLRSEELGVRPLLGVMWNGLERVALGATLSRIVLFDYERSTQTTFKGTDGTYDGSRVDFGVSDAGTQPDYPWTFAFGAAWFPSKSLLLSGDVSYYAAGDDREATWNVAAGIEYYFTARWALRAGAYTDHANTPELAAGASGQPPHVDLYGTSLSVTHFTANSSLTVGGTFGFGDGAAQIAAGSAAIQDATLRSLSIYMSASYRY